MSASLLLYNIAYWSLWAWLPLLLRDAQVPEALVGDLAGLTNLAAALVLLPIGWVTDRYSPRAVCAMGAALAMCGAVSVAVAGHQSLPPTAVLYGAMITMGLGHGLFLVALHALFFKTLGAAQQGRHVSSLVAVSLAGYAIGPLLGSALARGGLTASALGSAALFAVLLATTAALPRTGPVPVRLGEYVADLRRPGPPLLLAIIALTSTHSGVEMVGTPVVATEGAGLDRLGLTALYLVIGLWAALMSLGVGRAFDRSPRPLLWLALAVGVSGLFQTATAFASGFASLLAIRMVHAAGDATFLFLIAVLTARVFPSTHVGGLYALTLLTRVTTIGVCAEGAGRIQAAWDIQTTFVASGLLLMAGAAVIVIGRSRLRSLWITGGS